MAKNKFDSSLLIVIAIMIVVMTVYFLGLVRPYLSKRKKIVKEINQKIDELELFRKEKGGVTSQELIDSLRADQDDYRKKIEFLKKYLGDFKVAFPSGVTQKGLFFKEQAYQSERRLRENAENKGMVLPDFLGFDKGVPKEENAELLLWELMAVEKIVGTLIESGIASLSSLNIRTVEERTQSEVIYDVIPVEIKCQGRTQPLLKFVYDLSRADYPLIIEKADIQKAMSTGKDNLEINLTIDGIRLKKSDGDKEKNI